MGSANRGGFDLVDKAESTEYDFGLGLKVMMMGNPRNPNGEIGSNLNFGGERDARAAGGCSSGGNFRVLAADDSDSSPFRSWGGKMFTASQRQELQRQTMIFKYMAASVPVPPELLIHIGPRYSSIGGKAALDQEPWRCRRTDGKKWRCSRDAAPDQKYCERHSHKPRPSRSRKLVESSASLSNSNPTRRTNNNNNSNSKLVSSPTPSVVSPPNFSIKPSYLDQTSPAMLMPQQYSNNSRYPYWFMKREAHHAQETANSPSVSPYFGLDQMTSANNFMGNDQTQSPLPRQFLDAWSMGDNKSDGIVEHDSNLLTLSMAGGGSHEESHEAHSQLGMGLFESEGGADISNDWMCSSAPGGPLAEALWADVSESGADGGVSHGLGFMK